jgi:hypothetical protein
MHQKKIHMFVSRQIWIHIHLSSLIGYGFAGCQNQTNKRACTMDTHKFLMFEILFAIISFIAYWHALNIMWPKHIPS